MDSSHSNNSRPTSDERDPQGGGEVRSFYEQPMWKRLYAFLLAPFLIAAIAVGIFTVFSLMTQESTSPSELVSVLKSGGEHRRSQAAFALTKYLQPSVFEQDGKVEREPDQEYSRKLTTVRLLLPDLLEIFEDPRRGDDEVRKFLSLAFGYLGDLRAVTALTGVLGASNEELVTYALVSLTTLNDPRSIPAVIEASRRTQPEIRSTAIYALGVLGTGASVARLEEALTDSHSSVRWNAAFGLARHKNAAGEDIILEILNRGPIYQSVNNEPHKQREQFLNAVSSAGMLRTAKAVERLRQISQADDNLQAMNMAKKLIEANGL